MDFKEALRTIFTKNDIYKIYSRKEIVDKVKAIYNGVSDVLPSDYCYNITNKQFIDRFNTVMHIFEYMKDENYKYLGEGYSYTGKVTWKEKVSSEEKIVGQWNNGVYTPISILKETESMWIATIYMVFDEYMNNFSNVDDISNIDSLYFKQAEIIKTTKNLLHKDIHAALVSQHCNADHPDHSYNYLKSNGPNRRLVYYGEFNHIKECPAFSKETIDNTEINGVKLSKLIDFWKNEYTDSIIKYNTDTTNHIDFKGILDYINEFGGKPYKKPESINDVNERNSMEDVKHKATDINNQFKLIAQKCIKSNSRFVIDGTSQWLDGSNVYLRKYLWIEMKKPNNIKSPVSISLTAEKYDGKPRFRIDLEIKDRIAKDKDFYNYHRYLDVPTRIEDKFQYIGCKSTELSYEDIPSTEVENFVNKIKNGEAHKILMGRKITYEEVLEQKQSDILAKIMNYVNQLEKYYDKAVEVNENEEIGDTKVIDDKKVEEGKMIGNKNLITDKNLILYGPPGTGKTYNTVRYAVAIIEQKSIEEIENEAYEDVFNRYNLYKKGGQIAFTTFHQSYGYEEFIEGIKPDLESESEDIKYKLEDGVFKKFCQDSINVDIVVNDVEIKGNPTIWKISLQGARENYIKTECFERGEIRIAWDEYDEIITDKTIMNSNSDKNTLLCFQDLMQIGDIVLSLYDQKHIDGIGIIEGNYEFDKNLSSYKRKRKVKWLASNIKEDIYEINGNTNLTLKTVYRLDRINPSDLVPIINKCANTTNKNININANNKNYVFIIDEINRGNISKIFGELITLIESSKRLGEMEEVKTKLPYSKKEFGVPNNVYILGTMNTADRSIALLDTALRRRFNFIEMLPETKVLDNIIVENIDIKKVLETINKRIEVLYDREHTIGHAYFTALKNEPTIKKLSNIFKNNIIPLLQEYFYEDYQKIQLVLGDDGKEDEYKFIIEEKVDRKIFKKALDIDLPEVIYKINEKAFDKIESYIGIYS